MTTRLHINPRILSNKQVKNDLDSRVLDSLSAGFQLIDFNWRYVYVNESVAKQGRASKTDLLGFTMMEKYPGIENTELFKVLRYCMRQRVSRRMENQFTFPDGGRGWFELRIEPVPEGLFILTLDITERKKAEHVLRSQKESLEERMDLRATELEQRDRKIAESIRYASRIQHARLPNKEEIYAALPQCFVLHKPKAIVSGDFYFFRKTQRSIYLAAADCTGEGVSGAMLSMLCSEKLNSAVLQNSCPAEVLSQLNKGLKCSLHQTTDESCIFDKMDLALCAIDLSKKVMNYTGANRPLWIVRKGSREVEEIKGTKSSIGGLSEDGQQYDNHEIKFNTGDTFYIFSDGYANMLGGKHGKKLTGQNFRELLLSIQEKNMAAQEQHLEEFAKTWLGTAGQVDDILVIGVRF